VASAWRCTCRVLVVAYVESLRSPGPGSRRIRRCRRTQILTNPTTTLSLAPCRIECCRRRNRYEAHSHPFTPDGPARRLCDRAFGIWTLTFRRCRLGAPTTGVRISQLPPNNPQLTRASEIPILSLGACRTYFRACVAGQKAMDARREAQRISGIFASRATQQTRFWTRNPEGRGALAAFLRCSPLP